MTRTTPSRASSGCARHRIGRAPLAIIGVLALAGCSKGDKSGEGSGPERDARFVADVYTWECSSYDTGGKVEDVWQGAFAQEMFLQYAPDALSSLDPPAAGSCSYQLDMFPEGTSGGAELNGVSAPRWTTDSATGEMDELGTGFWKDNVSGNVHSCAEVDEVMGNGATLSESGTLDGVATPTPAEVPDVSFDHPDGDSSTIEWGEEVTVSWEEHDWDRVWVQIRREKEGDAYESVTCNVTGDDEWTLSADMWNLLDENLNIEVNNLYVAFEKSDEDITSDGLKVDVVSRSIAVAIVQE